MAIVCGWRLSDRSSVPRVLVGGREHKVNTQLDRRSNIRCIIDTCDIVNSICNGSHSVPHGSAICLGGGGGTAGVVVCTEASYWLRRSTNSLSTCSYRSYCNSIKSINCGRNSSRFNCVCGDYLGEDPGHASTNTCIPILFIRFTKCSWG